MENDTDRRGTQDDVEAHAYKSGREPAEAADVQAHATRGRGRNDEGPPPEAVEREQPVPDADDDVQGHAFRSGR